MAKSDYYQTLGVSKSATPQEIKKAYRKLAMKYHPDRNAGDKAAAESFKEIQEAYAVLSNPQKRSTYDQFGHAGVNQGAGFGGGFNFEDIFGGGAGGVDFGDIFGDIFGGGRRQQSTRRKGADLLYQLTLTLEEAFHGVTKSIKVSTWTTCKMCNGSGAKRGSKPVTCDVCHGSGTMRMQHGFLTMEQTCSHCHGEGKVIKNPCPACHGQGRVQERKTLSVKIPAGVDNGDRVRLANEGEAGFHGAAPGDLYVEVHIKPHDIFERRGNDLISEIPVDFVMAALGGEIEIPTLDGSVKLRIPSETQTGKMFRLRGKGIKSLRSGRVGDLLCRVIVETPVNLNKEQKEMLSSFSKALENDQVNHSPRSMSWLDSVKKFFSKLKSV